MENEARLLVNQLYADAALHKIRAYQIADVCGITRASFSNWRTGKSLPSLVAYLKAKDALRILIEQRTGNEVQQVSSKENELQTTTQAR